VNWLDIVILITIVVGVWRGVKTGIIGAAIMAVGGLVGWMVAGRLSDDIGGIFDNLASDTIVTTASYVIIIAAAILASIYIAKVVRPTLTAATLGLSSAMDKIGGLVLGLVFGLVVSAVLIVAMARLTYDFEPPDAGPVPLTTSGVPVEATRQLLEDTLAESAAAPLFVDVLDMLPGNALGFVPSDFKASLDILDARID
jgi:uncharacterized membrane protein required for colicin V production